MKINRTFKLLSLALALSSAIGIPLSASPTGTRTTGAKSPTSLIVYFTPGENGELDAVSSASLTKRKGRDVGMVRALAEMIQENTGGDLVSIKTSVKYPADIDRLIDYAADEQKRNVRPPITSKHDDLRNYDVIFIGYPIWWYDMPMIMYSFFERYDLTGKRIIPFCVHNGSRFSSTIEKIAKLEPRAQVSTDGFTVSIQQINSADNDVARWVARLKLGN